MKLSDKEKERLEVLATEILNRPIYQTLQSFMQHGSVTTYEHSLHVASCAFWLNARLHVRADERELVTACLLHDFYLYDWHTKGDSLHGYHHPKTAAKYAKLYFAVSNRVVSAIETHMWPLTLFHVPSNRTAWLLTIADKICSVRETLQRGSLQSNQLSTQARIAAADVNMRRPGEVVQHSAAPRSVRTTSGPLPHKSGPRPSRFPSPSRRALSRRSSPL